MNRIVLMCALTVLSVLFVSFFATKGVGDTSNVEENAGGVVPYFLPQETFSSIVLPSGETPFVPASSETIKTIFLEPPTVDVIKNDLGGKMVAISGFNHQFYGSEFSSLEIIEAIPTTGDGVLVNVKLCADTTIVDRRRPPYLIYYHERVAGYVKIKYAKIGDNWSFKSFENTDLQRTLTPNTVAPPTAVRVTRYVDF